MKRIAFSILILFLWVSQPMAQERYTIKKGDTLWEISGRFLNDPLLWKEIWRLNPFITNPDLIYPGETIRLTPPVRVEEKGEAIEELPHPPQEIVERPVPEEKPVPKVISISRPEFKGAGFLSKDEFSGSGVIIGSKDGRIILGEGDEVYVSFVKNTGIKKGERFIILEPSREVKHPRTKKRVGYIVEPLGTLTITGIEGETYTGRIDNSYREIFKGARVKAYQPPVEEVTIKEEAPPVEGVIIASSENRIALGKRDIVYIDRGVRDGLKVGNIVYIYREKEGLYDPLKKRKVSLPLLYIGKGILIDVKEQSSAVYILSSDQTIYTGDIVMTRSIHGMD